MWPTNCASPKRGNDISLGSHNRLGIERQSGLQTWSQENTDDKLIDLKLCADLSQSSIGARVLEIVQVTSSIQEGFVE